MNAPLPTPALAEADQANRAERSARQREIVAALSPLLPGHALLQAGGSPVCRLNG